MEISVMFECKKKGNPAIMSAIALDIPVFSA